MGSCHGRTALLLGILLLLPPAGAVRIEAKNLVIDPVTIVGKDVKENEKSKALQKLDEDTAKLNTDTLKLGKRFNTISKRMNRAEQLMGVPDKLAKSLARLERLLTVTQKGIKIAEGVPQLHDKASKFEKSIGPALPKVRSARKQAENYAKKLEKPRKVVGKVGKATGKAGAVLNITSIQVLQRQPAVSDYVQGDMDHFSKSTRECVQGKVDDIAKDMDRLVVEMDRVELILLKDFPDGYPHTPSLDAFVAKLEFLEDIEHRVSSICDKLDSMSKALNELEKLMDKGFTVKIPYLVGHYTIKVSMSIILKGSKAIQDKIESIVSGAVWKAAKVFGLGKIVDKLTGKVKDEVNKLEKKLHLDVSLSVPGLDKLGSLPALPSDLLHGVDISVPSLGLTTPDFGLPHVKKGFELRDIDKYFSKLMPPRGVFWYKYGCK